jgi:O-antigen/teichoic acid export membrane protein
MKDDSVRIIKTIAISGIATIISYLINFFLTPYITDTVGIEAYGFVSIAKTATSYAQIFTIALTTFVVRYITLSYHQGKTEKANAYYSSSLVAALVIAGVIYFIAAIAVFNLEHLLVIPNALIISVKALFLLIFLNFVLTVLITPLQAGAYIKNHLDYTGILRIISYLIEVIALVALFKIIQPEVWVVGFGTAISALFLFLGNIILKSKLVPELKFEKKLVSLAKVKEMMSNGIWQSINSLGNVLNSGLDLLISNLMLTGVETGQIAVAKTIETMFSSLYQMVSQPFQPRMLKAYSTGNMDVFVKELQIAMKVCGYFSNVAFAGFVTLGWKYFQLWLPSQNTDTLYNLAIITIFTSITAGCVYPLFYVNTLTLKKKIPCLVTVASGILNTIFMFILLKYTNLGSYAIVLTTAVLMTAIYVVFTPIYAARCLQISVKRIYVVYIWHFISAFLMIVFFEIIAKIANVNSWIQLILCALFMSGVGLIIHAMVMTSMNEKRSILRKIFRGKYS